jgi:hypothetical protein
MSKEEKARIGGLCGWAGCNGIPPSESDPPKEPYEDKYISITFKFKVPDEKEISFDGFKSTPSPNCKSESESIGIVTRKQIKVNKPVKYGVYKKSGFDNLYKAMKQMKPDMTERYMATNGRMCHNSWDEDYVDLLPFTTDEGCIYTLRRIIMFQQENQNARFRSWP